MSNKKQTSPAMAHQAAQTLLDPHASKTARSLAGSALAQANTGKQPSAEMESLASRVMQGTKYSEDTKSLAASVLSQSDKKR